MKEHEDIAAILAVYRDALPEERTRADAHVAVCSRCAARKRAFADTDAALAHLPQPALPPGLARPLTSLLAEGTRDKRLKPSSAAPAFIYRGLAPAGLLLLLAVTLSVMLWSFNSFDSRVTLTPTLTATLTPTVLTTRETDVVGFRRPTTGFASTLVSAPTPAPVPAPASTSAGAPGQMLLVGSYAHARMIH